MSARLEQIALEALTNDSDPKVRLDQQALEVVSVSPPPARLEAFSVEVASTVASPVRVDQFVVEVLSSSTSVIFDPTVAFWSIEPGSEVIERWQWKTDVQIARSGAQVRSSLRVQPRVQVEFDVATVSAAENVLVDAFITGWQSKVYYLPVWQDRARLTANLSIGATTISTPLSGFGYVDGELIAIWTDGADFQVLQIADADGLTDTLTLAQPLTRNWAIGAYIAPVRRAWLQPETSAARFTGSSMEARLIFNLEEPVSVERLEWDTNEGGPWTADGLALFTHRPNWTQAPRVDYQRRLKVMGDGTNRPWRDDVSGRGWISRAHLHTATSRAEINKLISWVAERRGRARSYMAPVWDTSIEITRSNLIGDTELYVTSRNYEQFLSEIRGRGYVALRDATGWIVRRITGASLATATEDKLTLSAAIGRAGTPAGWLDAVLCEPAHLTSDTLELRWWSGETADLIIGHQQVIA